MKNKLAMFTQCQNVIIFTLAKTIWGGGGITIYRNALIVMNSVELTKKTVSNRTVIPVIILYQFLLKNNFSPDKTKDNDT